MLDDQGSFPGLGTEDVVQTDGFKSARMHADTNSLLKRDDKGSGIGLILLGLTGPPDCRYGFEPWTFQPERRTIMCKLLDHKSADEVSLDH